MADETQVTETAPVEEKKGRGASGFIGGVAGAAGAFTYADNLVANKGIKKVINPEVAKEAAKDAAKEAKAPQFQKMVDNVLKNEKNAAVKESHDAFQALNKLDLKDVTKVTVGEAKDKVHEVAIHAGEKVHTVKLNKLPKELTVGEHAGTEALEKLTKGEKPVLKTLAADMEKGVTKSIRKADGFFAGVKHANGGGKAAIIGATIAGAVVGSKVLHAIFGGKHTNKVQDQSQQQEAGQARA